MLFSRDDLLRVLRGLNPWWTGRAHALPAFRRPMYAACRRHVEARSERFVLLLSGMRGTGKTTMLLQLAADLVASGTDPRNVLYLGMGHPIFSRVPLPLILQLHREMTIPSDAPTILLLDELHYARDWDQHVKSLLVHESGYRIVATESVQMIERALVTETQIVRWNTVSSPSVSFHEYLRVREADPAAGRDLADPAQRSPITALELRDAAVATRPAAAHFLGYLADGGLPWLAAQPRDAGRRAAHHEDTVENVLRRDVALHFGVRHIEDLKRLFVYLCVHSGDVFPVQRYARAVEISTGTVANHLDLLERCFLVRRLAPFGTGDLEVKKARYRVFVSDATLRNAQLLRDEESLTDPDEVQRVVATSIVRHVVERYSRVLAGFGYWRDPRTRRSVDLVVREDGRQTAFQVAAGGAGKLAPDDPLVALCRREPVARAFLVTAEGEDVAVSRLAGIETEFVTIPAYLLAYLLGRLETRAG